MINEHKDFNRLLSNLCKQTELFNNKEAEPLDVITFYNHRGCQGEHHYKELDCDFSWNKLPFNNFQLNFDV